MKVPKICLRINASQKNKEFSVYKFIEPEDTDLTALAHFSEITTLFNSLMKNGNVESFMQNSLGQFQFKPKNSFPASLIKVQLCLPQRLLITQEKILNFNLLP